MHTGLDLDQLRGDADSLAKLAHRASEHIAHAQLAADPFHIDGAAPVGEARIAGDHKQPADAGQAGDDVLDHSVSEIFLLGVGAQVVKRQHCDRWPVGYRRRYRCRRGGPTAQQAIDAHRASNVLNLIFAQILERDVKLIADLVAHDPTHTDSTRLCQGFEAGGEVDAAAVNVALVDYDIAKVNADAELDAPLSWDVSIALGHSALHLDRAAHRIDDTGKLHQRAVAGGFDEAATVLLDPWVDQFALQCL